MRCFQLHTLQSKLLKLHFCPILLLCCYNWCLSQKEDLGCSLQSFPHQSLPLLPVLLRRYIVSWMVSCLHQRPSEWKGTHQSVVQELAESWSFYYWTLQSLKVVEAQRYRRQFQSLAWNSHRQRTRSKQRLWLELGLQGLWRCCSHLQVPLLQSLQ